MTIDGTYEMLDISNRKAKAILYSLAKKFNGKPRIETHWRKANDWQN